MKIIGKILCLLGWHGFTAPLKDYVEEFGSIPTDGRIAKTAKCSRCNKPYVKKENKNE